MKVKKIFPVLLVMLLLITVALTSCIEGVIIPGVTDQTGGTGNQTGDTNRTYTVKYMYGDTALLTQTVTGGMLTDAQKAEKGRIGYKGNKITDFYSDAGFTTPFDFDSSITENTTVYCAIFFNVNFHYGDDIILQQKVNSQVGYLDQDQVDEINALKVDGNKFTGMYTDKAKTAPFDMYADVEDSIDVYCHMIYKVYYQYGNNKPLYQEVDPLVGFTEEDIKQKDEFKYHGFFFDYFYSDSYMRNEFDFNAPLKGDTIVYCERDYTKAGKDVYWNIKLTDTGATISFTGEGDMYQFLQPEDVPWNAYKTLVDKFEIEEGITSLADCAFYQYTGLTEISFPSTMRHIGTSAFFESQITDIDFPESLKTIGENAFKGCENLIHLNFNPGLEFIGDKAFFNCTNIFTVVLTDTIMEFGSNAFFGCTGLFAAYYIGTAEQYEQINMRIDNYWINELAHTFFISEEAPAAPGPYWYYDENGDIAQWYYTIWYMENNTARIPFTVDYVDVDMGVTKANIDFMNNIVHEGYKFAGFKKDGEKFNLSIGDMFTDDIKVIGDRGDICGDNLQWSCESTYNSSMRRNIVTLIISKIDASNPDGAMWDFQEIDAAPWNSRKGTIDKVVLSDGVTHIGKFAFVGIMDRQNPYTKFTYIDIPLSVTSVHTGAFYDCSNLLYIYYAGTPTDLYGDPENGVEPRITGLTELVSIYDARVYAYVGDMDYTTLGEGAYWDNIVGHNATGLATTRRVAWIYENGSLLVGGGDLENIMINYVSHSDTPWYSYRDSVTSVVVNKNITTIGHHSFENMTSVTEIVVPKCVTKISGSAFYGTGYYNTQYNEKGVVYINTTSDSDTQTLRFYHLLKVNPEMLKEDGIFILQERTLSIAEQAFEGCESIKHLVMTKDIGVQSIYSTAMSGLTGLEAIYYDGQISAWDQYQNIPSGVPVYFHSQSAPTDSTYSYWYWNNDKSAPVIWES